LVDGVEATADHIRDELHCLVFCGGLDAIDSDETIETDLDVEDWRHLLRVP
jgi:cytochrome c-type biogenesis protein CcmH/NrfF